MSPGEAFCNDLLEAMPSPHARMLLAARLASYAGQTIYLPAQSKTGRRIQAARRMMENRMTDAEIVGAIACRFGVCRRTAYRDVIAARKMST